LLRSTPLLLVFQHNNLTGEEWSAIRRELKRAIQAVGTPAVDASAPADIVPHIGIHVVRSNIFRVALRVVEFFDSAAVKTSLGPKGVYAHDVSKSAYAATNKRAIEQLEIPETSSYAQLEPVLIGPLALLSFPAISPTHLAAALSALSPSPAFPAPTKRKNPAYYDPVFQNAVKKLLLVGGRIESKVFDVDGIRWVGGIQGGLDGLRAQLVALLQMAGMNLTSALEGAGKSLWLTMESRRSVLEEDEKKGTSE
jgi:large subunit ribosomal protein L10